MPVTNRRTTRCQCWGSTWFLSTFAVLSFVFFFLSCMISYAMFKLVKHDTAGMVPFISDTGAYRPESCVFGQLLNITGVIVGLTAYFRFKQVQALLDHLNLSSEVIQCCGCSCFSLNNCLFGLLSALGMSIVGNFQVPAPTLAVHFLGAGMAFGCGMVYLWMQTILSLWLRSFTPRRWLPFVKLVICCGASIAIAGMIICGGLFLSASKDMWLHYRNCTAVFEWVTAILMGLYFTTFVWDFKEHAAESPRILINIGTGQRIDTSSELGSDQTSVVHEMNDGDGSNRTC